MPDEQWRRNRLAICVAAALLYAGFTSVMPFLPLYVRDLGVRDEGDVASWAGLLMTAAPLIASLLAPLWGRLGDRYGMRLMIERCTLAMALHWGFFGFARSPYHLLWLRIVLGLFGGFNTLALPALVAGTPKEYMSRSIGLLQTVQMVSAAVGPMLGGLLADSIGIRNTCLLSALLGMLAWILVRSLYRDQVPALRRDPAQPPAPHTSWGQAVSLPSFGAIALIVFFVSFIERSFSPVIPLYVLSLGTAAGSAARTSGIVISLGLLAEAVSATTLGSRLRNKPARPLLLYRLAGGALACLPMGLVWATPQLLVLRLLLGLMAGGCMVVVYTLSSQIVPAETRATSFSFLSSAALLGGSLGPVVAGLLTHFHIRTIFFFNSVIFLLLLATAWRYIRTPK